MTLFKHLPLGTYFMLAEDYGRMNCKVNVKVNMNEYIILLDDCAHFCHINQSADVYECNQAGQTE